jgi:hypothetical protein
MARVWRIFHRLQENNALVSSQRFDQLSPRTPMCDKNSPSKE